MSRLEDLQPTAAVRGILPDQVVTVVSVQWFGSEALELTYKGASGRVANELLYRHDEPRLQVVEHGRPWSFDGDGHLFRLVSEAHRIRLAHLFDPVLAVHTSLVEPLPHQITAVYEAMLPRQPLRFLLADDPGAGKTIMAGLFIKELIARGDLQRCLVVCPGSLAEQWQDELYRRFQLNFEILTNDKLEAARTGNWFLENNLVIARLDKLSRNEDVQHKLQVPECGWDLVVCDEAHKLSATFFGGEVKYTKRYRLGQLLSTLTRHFLLMTATPHNGKEEDFQLFLALLDGDRFEGRFRDGVHQVEVSDLMRRMVKENLLKFDGTPLFPERIAYTVPYKLSDAEARLYKEVTGYVREEFNRADALANDKRAGTVGFALTILQRRLASSPEAIYQSLRRRSERLQKRLRELEVLQRGAASEALAATAAVLDPEDVEDLDEAPDNEVEAAEEEILDQATAARTIGELKAEIATLGRLESLAHTVRRSGEDRKWKELASLLGEIFGPATKTSAGIDDEAASPAKAIAPPVPSPRQKLVVFTEHRDTLSYLEKQVATLLGRADAVVVIHGGMGREERMKAQESFKHDPEVQVLLATDAAGEGINLQRAHLMVNYDLPWNPNRIEQRFGRIHRIGQTEVCHLWNLVAEETREGDVYRTLLEKLEQAREALGGQVFDVLGRLQFEGRSLRELLIEAVRYGEQPEVQARLTFAVADAVRRSHLQELIEERALAHDVMDSSRVARVREEMERAEARRLQPHYIESFFLEAFQQLGGTARQREPRRYEVTHVPAPVRNRDRLIGTGDPVVQLQTNFGGGKTHSMLALYHLFSGTRLSDLAGIDAVLQEADATKLPTVKRVVLVGNKISPGNPVRKPDGTMVRTLWGELAWQLGGKKAFERVRADDEKATSPGDALRELFIEYGPCLVLIDEWVTYARQLHDQSDLPAGGFETQFTFAQVLTESAKLAKNCLLVISLPASDTGGSPHTQADDVEVGGQRGREALDRLRNVVGRVESTWRPASAEESFEIVRRRLFEPLADQAQYKDRDVVARAFADLYRTQHQEFPPECHDADYEKRIKAAYPIHPEIFDRLYTDWSTLVKFQRTRGVLRLMAAVIHSLWEKGDKNPLILPANIAIDDPRVQFELTRYLSDNWVPVLEKDVDGANSLPLRLDGEVPNLGKFAACRRVARTIYMGSAPTAAAAHRGVEDRRIKLGCVMPGESPAVFGDALRRLAAAATYLYQDGARYWYSTQPTVTKLAEDRAEQLKREPDKILQEMDKRLRADLRKMGDFKRVHPMPASGSDVPDDLDARLVVLSIDHAYSKEPDNAAEIAAKAIFEKRGNAPRLYRNTIVFLAADKTRLQDLDEAVRKFLAWQSILDERETLDLSHHQVTQAETQKTAADGAVIARLPETYQWLLAPTQATPQAPVTWQTIRLLGDDALAERASKKLKKDESLVVNIAASRLRMEMDRVPLWRGNHVAIRQLVEDFGRYLYLPRLQSTTALLNAIRAGLALLTWEQDAFAYAESYDESAARYRGLQSGVQLTVTADDAGLLVRPEVARQQMDQETTPAPVGVGGTGSPRPAPPPGKPQPGGGTVIGPVPPPRPKRYHGTVGLDPARAGRDAGRIADEVITHLVGLVGSKVQVTLEIEAEIPDGASDTVVRTVTENSRTLKFASNSGFETE